MSKMSKTIAILGVVAGLGVAALPLSSYAVTVTDGVDPDTKDGKVSGDTAVILDISDVLEMTLDKDTTEGNEVDLTADGHTGTVNITVKSNSSKGYNLAIKGSDTPNATSLTNQYGDQIVKGDGTFDTPAVLSTTESQWGYSVAHTGSATLADGFTLPDFTGNKYIGVGESDQKIIDVKTPTANDGDTSVVTFAATVKNGQAAGKYEGQVTFTATNNPTN